MQPLPYGLTESDLEINYWTTSDEGSSQEEEEDDDDDDVHETYLQNDERRTARPVQHYHSHYRESNESGGIEDEEDRARVAQQRVAFTQVCARLTENDAMLTTLDHDAWIRLMKYDSNLLSYYYGFRWTDRNIKMLGLALQRNTHLTFLMFDLLSTHEHYHVQDTAPCPLNLVRPTSGIHELAKGIAKASSLKRLMLGGRVCRQVQACLFKGGVNLSTSLQQVALIDNGTVHTPALAALLKTSILAISTTITPTVPPQSRHGGGCSRHLLRIMLLRCHITDMDMLTLALALQDNRVLLALNAPSNQITSIGIIYFCQHWKDTSGLRGMDLSGNKIDAHGVDALMRSIARFPNFINLLLHGNETMGPAGLGCIGEHLPHVHLLHLDITACVPKDDESITATTTTHQLATCTALANGLRNNTSLLTLKLGQNNLGPQGVQLLMRAIAAHPSLKMLSLERDESIGFQGIQLIGLELPHVRRLQELKLDGVCASWSHPQAKAAREAGQALLHGIQHNVSLTDLSFVSLPDMYMDPIQFQLSVNDTCRPFFNHDWIALWPRLLARFDADLGSISHVYFSLREQPWLLSNYTAGNKCQRRDIRNKARRKVRGKVRR